MKYVITFLISLLLFTGTACARAQDPMATLTEWANNHPIEKLYVHTDRTNYFEGETIWLKGYFLSDFLPSNSNSVMYIGLWGDSAAPVASARFPVFAGTASGQMDIPENLPEGNYQLIAYSPLMLNFPDLVFRKQIHIFSREKKIAPSSFPNEENKMGIFPEGGSLIAGIPSNVAFKFTDKQGTPKEFAGHLVDENGAVVTEVKREHDGMGKFSFVPISGEQYYLKASITHETFALPVPEPEGVSLNVAGHEKSKSFTIYHTGKNKLKSPAVIIGQMQNQIVFRQSLDSSKQILKGYFNTTTLPSGILQLVVLNPDGIPLAERLTFINNMEYRLSADFLVTNFDEGQRAMNELMLAVPDSIIGTFSVSVTDNRVGITDSMRSDITSWLLLESDLKGTIYHPGYYFRDNSPETAQALDLLMMVNGWTRYHWSPDKKNPALNQITDPGFIRLAGTIRKKGTNKPISNSEVFVMITSADSTIRNFRTQRMVSTDEKGRFQIDSLLLPGDVHILFSETGGNKNKFIEASIDRDSLPGIFPQGSYTNIATKQKQEYAGINTDSTLLSLFADEAIVLENITIKGKQKTELDKLDEEYSTGLFSGHVFSRRIDMRNEIDAGGDVFQFLQERIPGLKITYENGNYSLNYRGGNLTYYISGGDSGDSSGPPTDNGNVALFLNEMPATAFSIAAIPINQIALVKLFPTSTAVAGGGSALVIYTKKIMEYADDFPATTDIIDYKGFTISREFYSPDYETQQIDEPDNRLTLLWIPDLIINGKDNYVPIRFYNSDHARKFRVTIEGMTSEGRFLKIEKVIGNQ